MLDVLLRGKFTAIRLRQSFFDFLDLPFIQGNIFADGFCRNKRATAADCAGQALELFLHLSVETRAESGRSRHKVYITQHLYALCTTGWAHTAATPPSKLR